LECAANRAGPEPERHPDDLLSDAGRERGRQLRVGEEGTAALGNFPLESASVIVVGTVASETLEWTRPALRAAAIG